MIKRFRQAFDSADREILGLIVIKASAAGAGVLLAAGTLGLAFRLLRLAAGV